MSRSSITCAAEAAAVARPVFARWKWKQEVFVVLLLDQRHGVLGRPLVAAVGTANGVAVHPRDVFREAVRRNACALVVAHNHPSGDSTPSGDDLALTTRLAEAAKLLEIKLLDHVIVTHGGLRSLAEEGRL
jgi:DNA repair protein RadC